MYVYVCVLIHVYECVCTWMSMWDVYTCDVCVTEGQRQSIRGRHLLPLRAGQQAVLRELLPRGLQGARACVYVAHECRFHVCGIYTSAFLFMCVCSRSTSCSEAGVPRHRYPWAWATTGAWIRVCAWKCGYVCACDRPFCSYICDIRTYMHVCAVGRWRRTSLRGRPSSGQLRSRGSTWTLPRRPGRCVAYYITYVCVCVCVWARRWSKM
jgi:hypothetical protein